jgi:hypothetical protein
MNHPAAEVQCIPPAQRQRHTSASSSQGMIQIQPETTKAPCRTKCYPFWAQKPRVKSRVSVLWRQSLDDWSLSIFSLQMANKKCGAHLYAWYARWQACWTVQYAHCHQSSLVFADAEYPEVPCLVSTIKCISYLSKINNLSMYFWK